MVTGEKHYYSSRCDLQRGRLSSSNYFDGVKEASSLLADITGIKCAAQQANERTTSENDKYSRRRRVGREFVGWSGEDYRRLLEAVYGRL